MTKTKFRITGVLLTIAMLLATFSSFAIPTFAAEEDGSTDVIDASAMTADELQAAVTERLNAGHTAITVNLAEDADATMFSAITAALATTVDPSLDQYELVMNYSGTIDLTISGAKTVPECTFYVDEYVNENWRAGAALRSVTLTDATTIGESAFFSCAMTSFSAPNVIEIEGFALEGCMKLTDVYLPSVQTLGDAVFSDCYALKTISLPECIDLGNGVFNSCEALETVYAPKATNLGAIEFMMCTSLMKVTLGSVVSVNQLYESIDNGLFCLANDTKNIELILACDQKALSFDSSTKYWTATEEAFDFGNTNDFMGYTFKSITMAHTPEADDGDCTTALICSACGETVVEAKESHTTELDENKATCQHGDICDLCGTEYGATDPHSFVDGKCACGMKQFDFYGQQLNIGGDLSMKYYVTAFGDGVSTETLKMKFIFLGRETVVSGIYNAEMGMYVFTLEGINPQCMGDKIDAYLLLGDEEKASKLSYTVEENLLALRKEYEDDEALVTLVNDILAYGTAASEYKDHNSMTTDYVGSQREIPYTNADPLGWFEGYTVVFGQVNYIKVKVDLMDKYSLYLDGVDVTDKVVDGIFQTSGIAPSNFNKTFRFEIKSGSVTMSSLSISVNDYIYAQRNSATMGKLVKALYNYGESARYYSALVIDGTLGGKAEATEEDVRALVDQIKAYLDSGNTTIIVTGSEPAIKDMGSWTNTAIGEAIYRLSGDGIHSADNQYNGKIDLILQDVTEIVVQEFFDAYALNSINLPKVTTVGDEAFQGCDYLKQITFGSVVTSIAQENGLTFVVGDKVGGCDLVLNCGQMQVENRYRPELVDNVWFKPSWGGDVTWKSITLTHTGECDECKANH